jgi:uncharacterized protein YndB with AHSA1/START domain
MSTNQIQVETKGEELVLTRQFDAPREKVFRAYSDCKHLKNWWGPRTWPLTQCKMDFRVGGKWHYCMTGPDGTEAWGLMIYKEIVAPERIVYEDHFSDKDGNQNKELPTTVATTEFQEKDGKTIVKTIAKYPTPDDLKKVIDMGMIPGITETFDRLEEYLVMMK